MNKTKAEHLIICAYDLENKNHDKYLGFISCLKYFAHTDKTLRKMMQSEGYNV